MLNCKNGYLNESDLVLQLGQMIDMLDFNKVAIKEKIVDEVNRFKKFQAKVLKSQTQILFKEIDLKDYVKFILDDGEDSEKREILSCFKNRLIVKNKEISFV